MQSSPPADRASVRPLPNTVKSIEECGISPHGRRPRKSACSSCDAWGAAKKWGSTKMTQISLAKQKATVMWRGKLRTVTVVYAYHGPDFLTCVVEFESGVRVAFDAGALRFQT